MKVLEAYEVDKLIKENLRLKKEVEDLESIAKMCSHISDTLTLYTHVSGETWESWQKWFDLIKSAKILELILDKDTKFSAAKKSFIAYSTPRPHVEVSIELIYTLGLDKNEQIKSILDICLLKNNILEKSINICNKCGSEIPEDRIVCPKCIISIRSKYIKEKELYQK